MVKVRNTFVVYFTGTEIYKKYVLGMCMTRVTIATFLLNKHARVTWNSHCMYMWILFIRHIILSNIYTQLNSPNSYGNANLTYI